jgi:hypothetical protein
MKNDLTSFEKTLLRAVCVLSGKKYTHLNFMEWSSSEKEIKDKVQKGEKIYSVLGYFLAINEKLEK